MLFEDKDLLSYIVNASWWNKELGNHSHGIDMILLEHSQLCIRWVK